jgi:hypothetical protein
MNCPRCGMYVPSCPLILDPNGELYKVEGPVWHECPEPYPRETAEYLLRFFVDTGIPTSARNKARIKLGLGELNV